MTSTANPDYWSLLGISPDCSAEQLKRAFRREARRWHPDLNCNDENAEERFKLINEAYAVLSDPRRRHAWESSSSIHTDRKDPFYQGFPDFDEYIEIVLGLVKKDDSQNSESSIDDSHGEWPATSPPSPPPPVQIYEDLETLVHLTPEQSLQGTTVELELEDGTLVEVESPPMAGDGWRLRLPGVAAGGRDHFLQLRVQTDDGLRIDGLRVLYRLELFPHDALLGCAVDIPTLNGNVTLQVPPNSSTGRMLRLRGRGLKYEEYQGDQIVEIFIVLPENISDSELALYQRLNELSIENY